MAKSKKLTNKQLRRIVEREGGLEYAMMHYLDPEEISDKATRDKWCKCKELLEQLTETLELYSLDDL